MKKTLFILPLFCIALAAQAQQNYWQQHVKYTMAIDFDAENNRFAGTQELVYTNNSPDTLRQVFYHLYFNAFQPGSMMAMRTENIADPDRRMKNRFADLTRSEIGYQQITGLVQDGKALSYNAIGTILQVELAQPILPGASSTFSMIFNAQIPVQIRRSGRENKEEIDFTLTQWYPKMAEYDEEGWHPDQYLGREFYGIWGDFDVKITIDKNYVLGGTGVVQNPEEVGHGYASKMSPKGDKNQKITWHFVAKNVHDFAWAADPNFTHKSFLVENGPTVHLLYNPKTAHVANWEKAPDDIKKYFAFMADKFGKYGYPQFSVIQAGDGGMEYPMCTMVLGAGKKYREFLSLVVHEASHNWYYGMLASNEQKYPWMDEGFTQFAEEEALNFLLDEGRINPHAVAVPTYLSHILVDNTEPMSTGADHFRTNRNQTVSSYYKGELFLMQLQYIVGDDVFWRGMQMYFNRWAFKHPKPEDFLKVMEDASGMQLDWFLNQWTQTNKLADYAVGEVLQAGPSGTNIQLKNLGERPMPVDVKITLKDGSSYIYTIPLVSMYGGKKQAPFVVQTPWPWTNPTYTLHVSYPANQLKSIQIDPEQRSCDVKTGNNLWEAKD